MLQPYDAAMELRELEWFTTLARTEHVTSAAAELNISQPTLSRALARIERQLGVQLFNRQQNRLRLNMYGEIFRAHAERAMSELARGEERIRTLVDPERGVVSLGYVHSFGGWLVPDLLDRYRSVAASTTFELHGGPADGVVDQVRKGRIDIALVAPRPAAEDLMWILLGREDLQLGVPPGHPLADREVVSIAELAGVPLVALKAGYGLRHVMDQLFHEAGVTPTIAIEVTELSTARALVAAGMGVTVVPSAQPGQVSAHPTVPLSDRGAFRHYGAVARLNGPGGHAARRFLAFVAGRQVPDMDEDASGVGRR